MKQWEDALFGMENALSSGFAPRYSLREARVADGDSKNRTSLVRLWRTLRFAPRYSLWEARVANGDSKNRTSLVRLRRTLNRKLQRKRAGDGNWRDDVWNFRQLHWDGIM